MNNRYRSIDIIGGGIIGLTLATELVRQIKKLDLNTEVHLFERRGQLGIENTEKSFEGIRTYWFTPEELRFYLASIRVFQDLKTYFGIDAHFDANDPNRVPITAGYRPVGYHYFLSEPEFDTALRLKSIFHHEGIPLEFHTKEDARKIDWIDNNFDLDAFILDEDEWIYENFQLDAWKEKGFDLQTTIPKDNHANYDIAGYVRVPVAGFISTGDLMASCRYMFEKLGGKLHLNTEVVDVETSGNRVVRIQYRFRHESASGLSSKRETIELKPTDYIVNAAGVWSDVLNEKILDESLGIIPHRRLPIIVRPPKGYLTDHGMVLLRQRVIRPDGDKIWLYYTPPKEKSGIEEKPPDDRVFDEYFFKYIYPVFCHSKRPFIKYAESLGLYGGTDRRGWMGHYADTPDERPLIGVPRADRLENYAVSTGFSGHGVQASIAAALGLTHEILQLKSSPIVEIPKIYIASRDFTKSIPDHSRL